MLPMTPRNRGSRFPLIHRLKAAVAAAVLTAACALPMAATAQAPMIEVTDLAGRTMIPVLVRLSGIPEDTKVNAITHEQRMKLLHLFKAFPVSVTGTRPIDEAIVTAGGVSTKEINPRTMESKLMPGLYFAGEVLDLDGYTGGFNLQIAWSTGYVAGNSI